MRREAGALWRGYPRTQKDFSLFIKRDDQFRGVGGTGKAKITLDRQSSFF